MRCKVTVTINGEVVGPVEGMGVVSSTLSEGKDTFLLFYSFFKFGWKGSNQRSIMILFNWLIGCMFMSRMLRYDNDVIIWTGEGGIGMKCRTFRMESQSFPWNVSPFYAISFHLKIKSLIQSSSYGISAWKFARNLFSILSIETGNCTCLLNWGRGQLY